MTMELKPAIILAGKFLGNEDSPHAGYGYINFTGERIEAINGVTGISIPCATEVKATCEGRRLAAFAKDSATLSLTQKEHGSVVAKDGRIRVTLDTIDNIEPLDFSPRATVVTIPDDDCEKIKTAFAFILPQDQRMFTSTVYINGGYIYTADGGYASRQPTTLDIPGGWILPVEASVIFSALGNPESISYSETSFLFTYANGVVAECRAKEGAWPKIEEVYAQSTPAYTALPPSFQADVKRMVSSAPKSGIAIMTIDKTGLAVGESVIVDGYDFLMTEAVTLQLKYMGLMAPYIDGISFDRSGDAALACGKLDGSLDALIMPCRK